MQNVQCVDAAHQVDSMFVSSGVKFVSEHSTWSPEGLTRML